MPQREPGEGEPVQAEDGKTAERKVVDRQHQALEDSHRVSDTPLWCAAAASGVSLALAIFASGSVLDEILASPLFYIGVTGAFAASLWAAHVVEGRGAGASRRSFFLIFIAASTFRLMAIPVAPTLSDDIYRYLWDGHVQASGVNPYLHAPADPALDPLTTPYRSRINNPELPTIYPPMTQAVFFLAAAAGAGVTGMKLVIVIFDLGTILALAAILRHRGMSQARVVIYAWSPLAILETAWSGHADPVGVCLLMMSILAIIRGRKAGSVALAGLSGAAKYLGWLAIPSLVMRAGWRRALALPAAVAAIYLPYLSAGAGVFGSLAEYAERWRFNDALFTIILGCVEGLGLSAWVRTLLVTLGWLNPAAVWETSPALRLTEPLSIAKTIAGILFVAFAIRILRRRWLDPAREIFALLGGALLLSPTLHPWYLMWVAPFLTLLPRRSWTWLTYAALVFAYPVMASRSEAGDPLRWLTFVEYVPFFAILGIESARRRLWEG